MFSVMLLSSMADFLVSSKNLPNHWLLEGKPFSPISSHQLCFWRFAGKKKASWQNTVKIKGCKTVAFKATHQSGLTTR